MDFNVELSPDVETSGAMEEFTNIFCSHLLNPSINKSTGEMKISNTIIDNIFF